MPRPVPAPIFTPQNAGSLLTTATVIEEDRLLDGVAFKPEACLNGGLIEICPDEPVTKTLAAGDAPEIIPAYGFWEGDVCSTLGGDFDEVTARVSRAINNHSSFRAEQALFDGIAPTGNQALAADGADDVNSGNPVGVVTGFSNMIQALNAVLGGSRGIIHIPQWVVPFADWYNLITRNGNFLQVTGTDHLVIAGSGYSGNDPDGVAPSAGEAWIYGTGPVNVALSTVQVIPGAAWQGIDRSTNDIEVRAERGVAAWFNPCAHIGLPICLPDPGPDCGS